MPAVPFAELFATHSMILAPTELSATAPLKVAARAGGFRAATMPGFLPSMIPALRLDYGEINRRVNLLKELLRRGRRAASSSSETDGGHPRTGARPAPPHAATPPAVCFPTNGVAGNLPSGEAYIVPYEGEIAGDAQPHRRANCRCRSATRSWCYEIEGNRVRSRCAATAPRSRPSASAFRREPAYANLAELGLGVLGDFGLKPTGSILLDEKLGLHIAFGRSDHFGGTVGPGDFSASRTR